MPKAASTDPRIDAYIAKSPAFAQQILTEVRSRVHAAMPGIEETIKWNAPFFLHDGKLLVSVAAFKNHAKVLVWEGNKPSSVDVTAVAELPSKVAFAAQVKEAAARIDGGGAAVGTRAPAAKPAAAKTPSARTLAARTPAETKPAARAAAAAKPGAKKPVAKKPVAKKPAAKPPAAKKPVAKPAVAKKRATQKS